MLTWQKIKARLEAEIERITTFVVSSQGDTSDLCAFVGYEADDDKSWHLENEKGGADVPTGESSSAHVAQSLVSGRGYCLRPLRRPRSQGQKSSITVLLTT